MMSWSKTMRVASYLPNSQYTILAMSRMVREDGHQTGCQYGDGSLARAESMRPDAQDRLRLPIDVVSSCSSSGHRLSPENERDSPIWHEKNISSKRTTAYFNTSQPAAESPTHSSRIPSPQLLKLVKMSEGKENISRSMLGRSGMKSATMLRLAGVHLKRKAKQT